MQICACDLAEVHPHKKKEVVCLEKKKEKKNKNNGTLWI